ncbi:MAG: HD domain-containing protein, partial [Fibrobacteres bacterium]|nr:HD domain-containing protein [Fibrobacterota bacterium]
SELLTTITFSGNIENDFSLILKSHGLTDVEEHSRKVANEAKRIAQKFHENENNALIAGWLHDVSNIIPNESRINICEELKIDVLKEEYEYPFLLHPKLSKAIAAKLFNVTDTETLDAIECHTTLKPHATNMDMIVFIADKLVWESRYNIAFKEKILIGLEKSLEHAAHAYLKYVFDNKKELKVVHPWAESAFQFLEATLK